jgi:enoyl-CoA hydratase/carnithine racemase
VPTDAGITTDVTDGIASVTLNNPDRANSLTRKMYEALRDAWAWIESDEAVRAVVFTAAGDRHFCTGADVSALSEQGSLRKPGENFTLTWRQAGVTKPVVVAVNGTALGGGLGFVTDGNIVVATRRAKFVDTHVQVGQICGYGALRLVSIIGASEATRLAIAGGTLDAERAHMLGLVNELLDSPDEAKARAREIAATIVAASPTAVQVTLGLQRGLSRSDEHERVLAAANTAIDVHMEHPDATEGPRAWLEKRPAVWAALSAAQS